MMKQDYAGKLLCIVICAGTVEFCMKLLGFSPNCCTAALSFSLVALEVICFLPHRWTMIKHDYAVKLFCIGTCIGTVEFCMEWLGFSLICSTAAILFSLAVLEMFTHFPSSTLKQYHGLQTKVTVTRTVEVQKSHWRIKSCIPISLLHADKINSILADMRIVLAKNPQIEQQKFHRRVFLEDIDHKNHNLKISISCFVKTSDFDEYLSVKEDILLDLVRVASHHQTGSAIPIWPVDEPVVFDSKSDENFAGTSTSPPGVNSNDKSKSNFDAQIQNMDSNSSVEKTSKTMQPKEEIVGDVGKGSTTPASKNLAQSVVSETSPVTSHVFGEGETASATSSHSKQDEEKSSVMSSSVS
ncbi:hypothetical protein TSUD_304410 [Trifolium subterraneum]|uniref:Mechanosensitive ion channel protein 2/3 C-terminal domain-containing protein n=1 Tax=Trifolium subterraneum TaxID=3900 RepID=A0A2Z6LX46_TRISU|nr:hypothetical protein TSUD_304410 [Trifolium subterraneum]